MGRFEKEIYRREMGESMKTYKFESCLACQVCLYNRNNESTLCANCNGKNMLVPITESEIQELNLALLNANSQLRYYLDINPKLRGRNEYENSEDSAEVCQAA